ncbi:trihelix transcription factor ASR3 [Ziziphus jujuba]|uniref:Trihelix transcription factor ASR3 n=1 Tax=Ziziphus jujuba TaxID=326968 RepID=A0A6P4ACI3_ZIZJJ|nr:trihelix transcription factor ASR3 [Ziziphus jujuba]
MSEPTTTAAAEHHPHHRPTIQPPHFSAAQGGPSTSTATLTPLVRDYKKGNWTIQETMILITAKKLDEERRIKPASTSLDPTTKGELRWKWVENYCWSHWCLRSSNQCNDRWDNLLRDYKKVREYESNAQSRTDLPSYWNLEKHDRKLWNLPSNMALEVFQALNEVLQRKYSTQTTALRVPQTLSVSPSPAPLTAPPLLPAPMGSPPVASERSESAGTERSEKHTESDDTKGKKHEKIGSSMKRSASLLAKTLQNCEEKKEKRHREIMEVQRRRLEIEEAQNEVKQQGMVNLVTAMSNLSSAIQSLISDPPHHDDQQPT